MSLSDVCRQCPRACGADRSQTVGFCNSPAEFRVARVDLHPWEEPAICGKSGAGTIFFTGCNLRCVYCQNRAISRGNCGKPMTCDQLAAEMLALSTGIASDDALRQAEESLASGRAYAKFLEWIAAQGGDISYIEEDRFERAPCSREVRLTRDGYFTAADTERIGLASCLCGAGRMKKEDQPDLTAGLVMQIAPSERVRAGQTAAVLYAASEEKLDAAEEMLRSALVITDEPKETPPLIADVVR